MNWLLPEYLADALPAEAARIERLRRNVLDEAGSGTRVERAIAELWGDAVAVA